MAQEEIVFDPRGIVESAPLPRAPRPAALAGLRLGVLDNTKWNAGRLLRKTVILLEADQRLGQVTYYKKESFAKAADPALLAEIVGACDIVLTAIGD